MNTWPVERLLAWTGARTDDGPRVNSRAGTGERAAPGSGITEGMTPVAPSMVLVHDPRWDAVLARDSRTDFVYAVQTTRVYCRPSCPSRRPRPENVTFFPLGAEAERHGFRACRRCRPDETTTDPRTARVEAACRMLAARVGVSPSLDELATAVGTTSDTLRRDFRRVLGVSPKQYADALRVERLRAELRDGRDVTGALYTAGYGSSSRLYEQSDARLGMTPASYGTRGAGATIAFTTAPSPLGRLVVATTARAACAGSRSRPTTPSSRRVCGASSPPPTSPGTTTRWRRSSPRSSGASTATSPPPSSRSTCAAPRSSSGCGRSCGASRAARPAATARSPRRSARPAARGPSARRAGATRSRSSSRATASSRPSGALGGYAWGLDVKQHLLEREQHPPS